MSPKNVSTQQQKNFTYSSHFSCISLFLTSNWNKCGILNKQQEEWTRWSLKQIRQLIIFFRRMFLIVDVVVVVVLRVCVFGVKYALRCFVSITQFESHLHHVQHVLAKSVYFSFKFETSSNFSILFVFFFERFKLIYCCDRDDLIHIMVHFYHLLVN